MRPMYYGNSYRRASVCAGSYEQNKGQVEFVAAELYGLCLRTETTNTGGKSAFTQQAHGEFIVSSETKCPLSGTWIFHAIQTFNFTCLTLFSLHDLRL